MANATTVVVATNNPGKIPEIKAILGDLPAMRGMSFLALGELGDFDDPVESGDTFEENALIKARAALDATGLSMAIADDSGIVADALGGAPGVLSARWAGAHGDDLANSRKLLSEMDGIPDGQRTARFHTCVVLVARDGDDEEVIVGNGTCEGTIAHDMRGSNGFGYDPLFEPTDVPGRRMAELTPDEKNAISHRRRALEDLAGKL